MISAWTKYEGRWPMHPDFPDSVSAADGKRHPSMNYRLDNSRVFSYSVTDKDSNRGQGPINEDNVSHEIEVPEPK